MELRGIEPLTSAVRLQSNSSGTSRFSLEQQFLDLNRLKYANSLSSVLNSRPSCFPAFSLQMNRRRSMALNLAGLKDREALPAAARAGAIGSGCGPAVFSAIGRQLKGGAGTGLPAPMLRTSRSYRLKSLGQLWRPSRQMQRFALAKLEAERFAAEVEQGSHKPMKRLKPLRMPADNSLRRAVRLTRGSPAISIPIRSRS